MVIITIMIGLMMGGFVLFVTTKLIPILQLMFMDWIALIIISCGIVVGIIRLVSSKSIKIFEKPPMGKELGFFLRRDGICEPIYLTRPFHSESFLESAKVGLIHDLGKGSVYRLGDKNIRFVLENVNHTPNPTYANYTHELYNSGFDNMKQVQSALEGREHVEMLEAIPDNMPGVKAENERKKIDELLRKKYEN